MADDVAVARLRQHGALPERLRQRIEAHRGEEGLAGLHGPRGVPLLRRHRAVHVQVGHALVRLDQWIDVAPLLRPHVAQKMCGDWFPVGHLFLAVRLLQLRADVAVQVVVEGLHLLPEAVGVLLELLGRHVVAGPPHVAHVGEPRSPRRLVLQLDEARVPRPLLARRVVPGDPGVEQLVVLVAAIDDLGELLQIAPLRILGGAVVALEAGGERGHLQALGGVVDHRAAHAQQVEHPRGVRIELHVLEPRRGLRRVARIREHALVGRGGVPLGIVGDVRVLDPVGRGGLDEQALEVLVHLGDELLRVRRGRLLHLGTGDCGRRLLRRGRSAGQRRGCGEEETVFHGGAPYLNSVPKRQRSRAPRQIC